MSASIYVSGNRGEGEVTRLRCYFADWSAPLRALPASAAAIGSLIGTEVEEREGREEGWQIGKTIEERMHFTEKRK